MFEIQLNIAGQKITMGAHSMWHPDEVGSAYCAKRHATKEFVEQYCQKDKVLVGIGGGPFDEHARNGSQRKEGETCASLVAKVLRVESKPEMKALLALINPNDLNGAYRESMSLPDVLQAMNFQYYHDQERAIRWALQGIETLAENPADCKTWATGHIALLMAAKMHKKEAVGWFKEGLVAKMWRREHFFTKSKLAFMKAKIDKVGQRDQKLPMVTAYSDDYFVASYARSEHGCRAAAVIQIFSSGNVVISGNRYYSGFSMDDVAINVRRAELALRGLDDNLKWDSLRADGEVSGDKHWYYHRTNYVLMNGGFSYPEVRPTALPLWKIQSIVRLALGEPRFDPTRRNECEKGICTSAHESDCPLYKYGLSRCRTIRYRMLKKASRA